MMADPHEHDHRHETISREEKEDLLGLLHMRFGHISDEIHQKIFAIEDLDVLDRLFLVAVNSANWDVFEAELNQGQDSFKMVGDGFDPLAEQRKTEDE